MVFGDRAVSLVGFLGLMKFPLLLVGEELDEDQDDEDPGERHVWEIEFEGFGEGG